ncbi:MAG TPA: pyruvate dehydrogenase complex E1 component subunit beta [Thermopetrobacter sp.]|nr:pyruvate dehydrogenase complex E1 component subunit beta [Thermopetrobacter sp.]
MASTILMPALSPTMEKGTLAKWLVKEGDAVSAGDVIAEIETDKATVELETDEEGVVVKLLVGDGAADIPINTPIAIVAEEGEEVDAEALAAKAVTAVPAAAAETADDAPAAAPAPEVAAPVVMPEAEYGDGGPDPARNLSITPPPEGDPVLPDGTEYVEQSVREALRDAMAEEMRRDETVFLMGEEVAEYQGAYKVSQGLLEEFGSKRVIDTPITEHGFAGMGIGAAFAGLKPIVEFMTFNFAMQAMDQVINSAAKQRYMSGGAVSAPIVFRGPNGAAARVAGQHSQDYAAWYAHIPGVKVVMPYTAADAKGLLKAAIRDPDPVIFLENEILYGHSFPVPQVDDWVLPIGRARLARAGEDVTIVSFGIGMTYALKAAEMLAEEGISAEVIDLRTLRPMDIPAVIESVKKTNRLVTVEEGWPVCSIGSEIARQVMQEAFDWLDAPVMTIAGRDVVMPYAANLEKLALPTAEEVAAAAKQALYR